MIHPISCFVQSITGIPPFREGYSHVSLMAPRSRKRRTILVEARSWCLWPSTHPRTFAIWCNFMENMSPCPSNRVFWEVPDLDSVLLHWSRWLKSEQISVWRGKSTEDSSTERPNWGQTNQPLGLITFEPQDEMIHSHWSCWKSWVRLLHNADYYFSRRFLLHTPLRNFHRNERGPASFSYYI